MDKIAFYEETVPWSLISGGISTFVRQRAFVLARHDFEVWWCNRTDAARWDPDVGEWVDRRSFSGGRKHANPPSAVAWLDLEAGVSLIESPDNIIQCWRLKNARHAVQWHTSPNLREWLNFDPLSPLERLQRHVAWRLRRRVYQKAHVLLAPSLEVAYLQGAYYRIHPDRIAILPYVFSREAFRDLPRAAEKGAGYVLVAGNLEYFKGFDLLMKGYDRYRHAGGSLSIVFAGSAGETDPDPHARAMLDKRDVKDVINRWGNESIRFLGRIPWRKLAEIRAASNAVIVCSRFDAFTLVAGEAAMSGCPLLLSDRTGWHLQASMSPGMCQFDPYDSEAVAEALREAEDEGKRTSLIEATEKLASRISGEDV
jgi:glycosyltransferase involved in cell wall biosynthesis